MVGPRVSFLLVLAGVATAQFGFYDLDADEQTKLIGTTGDVLPDCMSLPTGMCGDGGRTVIVPDGRQMNLAAWYTFDDAYGLDHSGNANHPANPPPDVGPGFDGRGQSAHFSGTNSFVFPSNAQLDSLHQQTVSFWIYLLTDSTDSWRVVFRKGDETTDLTPTLLLFPDSRKLHVRVSTTDPRKNGLDSITRIPLRRWTHVAITLNHNIVEIFINGIKDNEGIVTGEVLLNQGSWYVGKDLHLPGSGMFIDNFKVHAHVMEEADLQVEASSALPGLGPNFLRLGCKSCEMSKAIETCASTGGYHLCRRMELNGGGLMIARAMGYLEFSSEHWSAEDGEADIQLEKLGLCCLD